MLLAFALAWAGPTVVISDLHWGDGKDSSGHWYPLEDFRWSADFAGFLDYLAAGKVPGLVEKGPVTLVIAGDMLELWQNSGGNPGECEAGDDLSCSEEEAVVRLKRVLAGHAADIEALATFSETNPVVIIPGNHDAALMYPAVGGLLRYTLLQNSPKGQITIATDGFWQSASGAVVVEHGHQSDPRNDFPDWPSPFATTPGSMTLRMTMPIGEKLVRDVFDPAEKRWPTVDNSLDDEKMFSWVGADAWPEANTYLRESNQLFSRVTMWDMVHSLGASRTVELDYDAIRVQGDSFFWEMLPQKRRSDAPPTGTARMDATSNEELTLFCLEAAEFGRACPRKPAEASTPGAQSDSLGGQALKNYDPDAYLRRYLDWELWPRVKDAAGVSVYITGHTHAAEKASTLTFRGQSLTMLNTGAFQVAAPVNRFQAVAAKNKQNATSFLAVAQPETLQGSYSCYTAVVVRGSNAGAPEPYLAQWSNQGGTWALREAYGPCGF